MADSFSAAAGGIYDLMDYDPLPAVTEKPTKCSRSLVRMDQIYVLKRDRP